MTYALFGLIVSYALGLTLLGLVIIHSRLHWGLKTFIGALIFLLYVNHYFALMDISGWPSDRPLPHRFRLIAGEVYEPNRITGSPGQIFLWATSMDENVGISTPRAYRLPYSRRHHDVITKALDQLGNGIAQMGVNPEAIDGPLKALPFAEATRDVDGRLEFHDIPVTILPEK